VNKRTFLKQGTLLVAASAGLNLQAFGQTRFPERPIRLVVPFAPGGDGDIMGRTWVKHVSHLSGVNVVVDNKAGAGGVIGATEVARAKADGYTLLLGTSTTQIINPAASGNPSYDPVKDFMLVGMVSINPTCIIINPNVPAQSVKELVALVKADPEKYAYGSAGPGTITNLTGELFKYHAGLNIQHIPYKGGGPALQDLISGHVPIITTIMSSAVLAQHRAGKARILSVNHDNRLKAAPDIPTTIESGLPDMRVQVFNAVFAPAGTPKIAMDFLKAVNAKVSADAGFMQDVEKSGAELVSASDPEKFFQQEVVRWNHIIKSIDFKI
jgi:tripartite-type tricarboxylate transporter receptor subunit TctC